MKYPKLLDKNDLRKKLMDSDVTNLKVSYANAYPFIGTSYRQWRLGKAGEYNVSPATIQYHTDEKYQALMKAKNAKAHSKDDMADYEQHRQMESNRRVERWSRNPKLREWHYIISANNEKRTPRKSVLGKPLERNSNVN